MKKHIKERLLNLKDELSEIRTLVATQRKANIGKRGAYYKAWREKQKVVESDLLERIQARRVPNSQPHLTPWKD